jgi:hypothetical protein
MQSPTPDDWDYRYRLIGSQWSANWELVGSDLEGREGKAFPWSAPVSPTHPLLRGAPRNAPGTVIPAALIMGIRSDLPGQITAQVTEAVYDSPTGKY